MVLFQKRVDEPAPVVEVSRDPSSAWERLAVRLQADLSRERDAHAATKRHLDRALDLLALHSPGGGSAELQQTGVDAWVQTSECAWDTPACQSPPAAEMAVEESDLVNQELGLLEVCVPLSRAWGCQNHSASRC